MAAALLDFSTPHVLRTRREYRAAAREIDALLDAGARRGTPPGSYPASGRGWNQGARGTTDCGWRVLYTPPHASWLDQAELLLRAFTDRYLAHLDVP